MNAGFVSEGVSAYHRFVRRDLRAGDFGEHAAGGEELLEIDIGGDPEALFAHRQSNDYFLERGVAGAFAYAIDGAFDLADACADCCERVGYRHAEVVVAMGAEGDALGIAEIFAYAQEHGSIFLGHCVTYRVRQIQRGGAGVDSYAADLAEEVDVRAPGVFGGEFDLGYVLAAIGES